MSDYRPANTDPEPDIVVEVLRRVRALVPELTEEVARQVELDVRAEYGGLRVRIAKRKKHLTAAERSEVYQQGLSNASDAEITERAGIHRATLYRLMKRGVGGDT